MTLLFLARHGETEPNRDGLLLGRSDPGLTERGQGQARMLGSVIAPRRPVSVVSSPLRRCVDTARAIAAPLGLEVAVDDRLIEVDYGDWEGMPLDEIPEEASARWREEPDFAPPGGESLGALSSRVAGWCEEQQARGSVVAVTHVSPVKAAVAWALRADPTVAWRLFVDVASITTIGIRETGPVLLGFNERGHLKDL